MNHLQPKIEYFENCCIYICDEFGLKADLPSREKITLQLKRLGKKTNINSIGNNYIWNFVTYILYKKQDNRQYKNFKLIWLTSKSSFDVWNERPDDWYVYHGRWLLENILKQPKTVVNINPRHTEETFRKKYLNTPKGFITCLENTSFIDPESRFCKICIKKIDCREILKSNNPELYNIRYNGIK